MVGLADHYFNDGHYYRHGRDYWHYSDRIDGKWHKTGKHKVPPGLSKKHHDKHSGKGRSKDYDSDHYYYKKRGKGHNH